MQLMGEIDMATQIDVPAVPRDAMTAEPIEVVYTWNIASDTITWGPDLEAIVGFPAREALGTGVGYAEHLAVESPLSRYEAIMAPGGCDTGGGVPFKAIYGLVEGRRAGTAPVWIEDIGRWFADARDRPGRAHGSIRVITERFEAERRALEATQRDPTTGAFTRAHFIEHLTRQLALASRATTTFAVMVIGLDRVDGATLDDALVAVAFQRLRAQMRHHEIGARHGAARIAVLLEGCAPDQAMAAARRFLDTLEKVHEGHPALRARIGAVLAPCHGRTPQALLQFAEEALEAARQPTSPPYVRFEPDIVRASAKPARASDELLSALNDGRVVLALQPIVEAKTGKIALYEALVRVRRLNGTLILPDALVPDAEKNGLVPLIDRRVIDLAFHRLTADRRLVLSINASVLSLHDSCWLEHLRVCCKLRPDAARRLTVEMTETSVVADIEATKAVLATIKPLGVKIAIDDFGSGHSSFRGLRQLPIDYLKIDGAFAQNLASSKDDRFFIRTLIDLARNLNIPTVCEWVEDQDTARILTEWGVDYLQGHLFGRAEIAPEIERTGRERAIG